MVRSFAKVHAGKVHLWLLIVLTFSTGVVDAAGFLGLGRVFVGNMTGNIVILGMGVAGADELPVTGPLVALVAFVVGAAIAGTVLRGQQTGWSPRITYCLGCAAVILAVCAVLVSADRPLGKELFELLAAAAVAGVMGGQAAVARKVDVKDVTTVVVTSTLTLFAAELPTKPLAAALGNRRVAAIVAILLGAGVGALLHVHIGTWVGLTLAAVLTGVVAAVGHFHTRTLAMVPSAV
ncbi:YoaK family protein [Nocardia sp. NPDC020380]|uniref:YoaK family protein n=1 Tax=Nocardia sp. NPDC020380 TaxID=3364309 RepID=UPI0037A9DAE0